MPENTTAPTETDNPRPDSDSIADTDKHYVDRLIPLFLIDPPSLPERETMDEVELANLAMDIMEIGLTHPLAVFEKDGRYEVIAGHRRFLACGLAGLAKVPCRVRIGKDVDPLAIMVSENAEREKVNPVEQARFYHRIYMERAGQDVDKVCAIVKRKRDHVEKRLLMLQWHPKVLDAAQHRQITLTVADELNKIQDESRLLLLLDVAIKSGATAKLVSEWRVQGAELGPIHIAPASDAEPGAPAYTPMTSSAMKCVFCEGEEYAHMMELLWVHAPCKTIMLRLLQRLPAPGPENGG